MDRSISKILFVSAILSFFGMLLTVEGVEPSSGAAVQSAKANIVFRWAFGARTGPAKLRSLVSISGDTSLKTGDSLKMLLELKTKCYVYVLHEASNGEFNLLYPRRTNDFEKMSETGKLQFIPPGDGWFMLDQSVGPETFYLLASSERLAGLEQSLVRLENAVSSAVEPIAKAVRDEMKSVRKRFKTFATTAERPSTIGGAVRGGKERALGDIAVEIAANNFYSKTITIDHR